VKLESDKMLILVILLILFTTPAFAQNAAAKQILQDGKPFSPDGRIVWYRGWTPYYYGEGDDKREVGEINGVQYYFSYTDGSGSFAGNKESKVHSSNHWERDLERDWEVKCKKDPITDKKMCYMKTRELLVILYGNGKSIVSIGHDNYPGSTVAIRIDGEAPIIGPQTNTGDLPTTGSTKVIERLKKAKFVTTRYMKWPYKGWVDDTWEVFGFNEAFQFLTWAVNRIN